MNESALHSAFIPFGEVKEVSLPIDHATGEHRGFGFVEFEAAEDAAAAMDNMHNSGGVCWRWLHPPCLHDGGRQPGRALQRRNTSLSVQTTGAFHCVLQSCMAECCG